MTELITIEELEKEIITKQMELEEVKESFGLNIMSGGEITINSLQVAEIFGKHHKVVLEKIRDIEKVYNSMEETDISNGQIFRLVKYIDAKGEERPMYELNRAGFSILCNKFTGKKALEFTIKYVGVFEKMDYLLHNISELAYRKQNLLLEQERNEIASDLEQYVGMYGNKLVPKDFNEYYPIFCHGYSNNYHYKPVIDKNNSNNIIMVKRKSYNDWIVKMKQQLIRLPKYVESHNIDLTKELYICVIASLVPSMDTENILKSLQDVICNVLGIDDNIVTSLHVYKVGEVDSYEKGRMLLYLRNDHLEDRTKIIK